MTFQDCSDTSQPELDLLQESLERNQQFFVPNGGNGMRCLLFAGDLIGIVNPLKTPAEIGRIVLFRANKLFFGGRIISGSEKSGWVVKSDCGTGESYQISTTKLVGIVDSFQIGNAVLPLWFDHKSQAINRQIAHYSTMVEPTATRTLFLSGRWLTMFKRKLFKTLLRRQQKILRKHLTNNLKPIAQRGIDGDFQFMEKEINVAATG